MKLMGLALSLPLLLVACPSTTPPPATEYKVEGTLYDLDGTAPLDAEIFKPWSSGAGTIEAKNVTAAAPQTVVTTGTVNTDGTFSVTLPATIADSDLQPLENANLLLINPQCTGNLDFSNKTARAGIITFDLSGNQGGAPVAAYSVNLTANADGSQTATIMRSVVVYANAVTTWKGSVTCQSDPSSPAITSSGDVNLKVGYNVLKLTSVSEIPAGGPEGSIGSTLVNGTFEAKWSFDFGLGLLTPTSLAKSIQLQSLLK